MLSPMSARLVGCFFDALADEWWSFCEPVVELELRLVLNWMAMLHGDDSKLVPLRVFKLECGPNPLRWLNVMVVVFIHQPKLWNVTQLPVQLMIRDLGLPVTWTVSQRLPSVPVTVRFKWDTAVGISRDGDVIDVDLPIRQLMLTYMTHSPPSKLRDSWKLLASAQATPCSPEERMIRQVAEMDDA